MILTKSPTTLTSLPTLPTNPIPTLKEILNPSNPHPHLKPTNILNILKSPLINITIINIKFRYIIFYAEESKSTALYATAKHSHATNQPSSFTSESEYAAATTAYESSSAAGFPKFSDV